VGLPEREQGPAGWKMFQAIPELLALSERLKPVQELRREQEERPGREQAQLARRVLEPEPGQAVRPGTERGPAAHREGPVGHRAGRVAQADWARADRS